MRRLLDRQIWIAVVRLIASAFVTIIAIFVTVVVLIAYVGAMLASCVGLGAPYY